MNKINVMGLRVVGMTAAVFLVLFGLYMGGRLLLTQDGGGTTTPGGSLSLADRTRDSDGDGMADLYETAFYSTDPQNPDTDGDGMNDRDEIVAGRDPLVPGPNDESKPATGSQITQVDTFTKKYLASLPDDIARDQILDQVRLEAFVQENRGELLPNVVVTTTAEEGEEVISAYLDAVSSAHNDQIGAVTSTDIEAAFRLVINGQDTRPMQGIVDTLRKNVEVFLSVSAPNEVVGLHTKMVAATQALLTNCERLLYIDQDFVGGLIAAKNIEDLGVKFQEMANSVRELEVKYGLE